jgi:hypothetical protein
MAAALFHRQEAGIYTRLSTVANIVRAQSYLMLLMDQNRVAFVMEAGLNNKYEI